VLLVQKVEAKQRRSRGEAEAKQMHNEVAVAVTVAVAVAKVVAKSGVRVRARVRARARGRARGRAGEVTAQPLCNLDSRNQRAE
jgi:hypothetical protein